MHGYNSSRCIQIRCLDGDWGEAPDLNASFQASAVRVFLHIRPAQMLRKCCANDRRNEAEIDINSPELWMWQLHCLILGHLGHSRTITLTQLTGHCEFNDNPIDRSFHRKLKCWLHWSTLQRSDLCGLTSSFLYQIIFCWLNLNVKLAKIWFFWWFNQVKPHYWMIESHVFTIKINLWMVSCWLTVG